jgi:hypothetical protein
LGALIVLGLPKKEFSENNYLRENTKIKIDARHSFTFNFPEKPKVGTTILKISVLNQSGDKVGNLKISAFYHMPAMPSMKNSDAENHDFLLNKKNDYLLPINASMAGDWEVEIIFTENSHEIYRGKILFSI